MENHKNSSSTRGGSPKVRGFVAYTGYRGKLKLSKPKPTFERWNDGNPGPSSSRGATRGKANLRFPRGGRQKYNDRKTEEKCIKCGGKGHSADVCASRMGPVMTLDKDYSKAVMLNGQRYVLASSVQGDDSFTEEEDSPKNSKN